jgi:methylated-DNA-[protein]-cysteine S-methyltransferase
MGGFSAPGGVGTKARLLSLEGVDLARPVRVKQVRAHGLELDVGAALRQLRRADARLGALIDRVGAFEIELQKTHSSFAALAEAIVYQQLHGKAAATIFGRFRALYPGRRFPSPADVLATPDETLRRVGLSRNKTLAIRDLAEKVQSGIVPSVAALRRMSNEDIIARLTAVRGIGRWTAEMLLIFRLGRPDVLPVDDYGVRKGWAVVRRRKELPSPAELARYGERWKPYRTVASWYLWRAADLGTTPS